MPSHSQSPLNVTRRPRGLRNVVARKLRFGQLITNPKHQIGKRRCLESNVIKRSISPWSSPSPTPSARNGSQCLVNNWLCACNSSYTDDLPKRNATSLIVDALSTHMAGDGVQTLSDSCCNEDWTRLKLSFAGASEAYENSDPAEAASALRAVLHDCHRLLVCFLDPSALFPDQPLLTIPPTNNLPISSSSDEYLLRRWDTNSQFDSGCQCEGNRYRHDPPTAFHDVLGTTLFYLGNLIAKDSSLATPDEPCKPYLYWLAALDVFETGETLPSRTTHHASEDWRMAITWGRTLVCLAEELLSYPGASRNGEADSWFLGEEPAWPPDSVFATIAAQRPPITRRMSFSAVTPNDLLILAMDQFSRGIFHMPHPHVQPHNAILALSGPSHCSHTIFVERLSRPKHLFTIASEVLCAAERLDDASERRHWALWADSVFNQMRMEADMDAWREQIMWARGRCWLTVGSAGVESIEDALEDGNEAVLLSEAAELARDGLQKAVYYFERARGWADSTCSMELQPLMVEALVTLANLTINETQREELYRRAQRESDGRLVLEPEMEEMESGS